MSKMLISKWFYMKQKNESRNTIHVTYKALLVHELTPWI
jgi:hypothetical protein